MATRPHTLPWAAGAPTPPPAPAGAGRCSRQAPVAELPVAVQGLQHAAGRLPLSQEQQRRPVPSQALGGTEVTAGGRAGGQGPPLAGQPLPGGLFPRRAGQDPPRTPVLGAGCGLCARGRAAVGAGHLGSGGASFPEEKDFVPETQEEWPRPPAPPVGAIVRRTESPGLGLVGPTLPGGEGLAPQVSGPVLLPAPCLQPLALPAGLGS